LKCLRCNGFMHLERIYTRAGVLEAHVCLNCGNVEDELILFNRIVMPLWHAYYAVS